MPMITVHQVRRETGACYREFVHYPSTDGEVNALLDRIERGYDLRATRVTNEHGSILLGTEYGAGTEFSNL